MTDGRSRTVVYPADLQSHRVFEPPSFWVIGQVVVAASTNIGSVNREQTKKSFGGGDPYTVGGELSRIVRIPVSSPQALVGRIPGKRILGRKRWVRNTEDARRGVMARKTYSSRLCVDRRDRFRQSCMSLMKAFYPRKCCAISGLDRHLPCTRVSIPQFILAETGRPGFAESTSSSWSPDP